MSEVVIFWQRVGSGTHICQSVSGAAPDGRLGLAARTLTVAVLPVVLPRFQLQRQKTPTQGNQGLKLLILHSELSTCTALAQQDVPQKSAHEYGRTGRICSAVSVNLSCFLSLFSRRRRACQRLTPSDLSVCDSSRPTEKGTGTKTLWNLQTEPLSFPSRHHMLRQQEPSECHHRRTLFEMWLNDEKGI